MTLDLGRGYTAEMSGEDWFRVYSPATLQAYLTRPAAGTCTCPDSRIRKRDCKHLALLRASLARGEGKEREVKMATESETHIRPDAPEPASGLAISGSVPGVPMPIAELGALKAAVQKFVEVRNSLLDATDIVEVGKNAEPARSGWDKVALAYGVSYDVLSCEPVVIDGRTAFRAKAKAVIPGGGRFSTGTALCTLEEIDAKSGGKRDPRAYHFAAATAESRAIKRAMVGLIGGGDLTPAEVAEIKKRK